MKSKMSFFNKGIFKQDLKQHGWIGVIYLLCLLFVVPLQMLLLSSGDETNFQYYLGGVKDYFSINLEGQLMFLFTVPVVAGIFLFRYLQNETSVDMIHSLPVKRKVHYFSHVISGICMLILPILITAIFSLIIMKTNSGFNKVLTLQELLTWAGIICLLTIFLFLLTVLVGMITGISVAQGILTYILLFLPAGLLILLTENLSRILFGFSNSYFMRQDIDSLAPFVRFTSIVNKPFSITEIVIYALFTVGFLIVGKVLYDYRHLERAGDTITFPFLKPIFKYSFTFCTTLLSVAYFAGSREDEIGWSIFGYVSGAIIGYIASEMILQKTWRIVRPNLFIGFGGYSIVIALLYFSLVTDVFGYEKKLPSSDEIEAVYIESGDYLYKRDYDEELTYSSDKLYIQDIRKLHKEIIQQKNQLVNKNRYVHEPTTLLVYKLKNGKTIAREYTFSNKLFQTELKPIIGSMDYKKSHLPLTAKGEKADQVEISSNAPIAKNLTLKDPKEVEELKKLFEKDYLAQSYEDIVSPLTPWGQMVFSKHFPSNVPDVYVHLEISSSYKEVEKWLADKNYLNRVKLLPEDIATMEIVKGSQGKGEDRHDYEKAFRHATGKRVEIKDKKIIEKVLDKFTDYDEETTYFIKMKFINGNDWYVTIREENIPRELIKDLK